MPGRLFLTATAAEIAAEFGVECPPVPARLEIAPGEEVLALLAGRRLAPMRWGMIPMGRTNARGRPVLETIVNARSETLFKKSAFAGVRRAILPVSGWYEWTGAARRKTRWRIDAPERPFLAFAAVYDVWTAPGGREVHSLATVTCPPNAEVAPVHDRMAVILDRDDYALWLGELDGDLKVLLKPLALGSLRVEPS